ncbi:membrane-bound lytic murein transglycosylase A [endosymbiont of Acanthamoeba sp. UWC8]|uniref:murein transglycosylase A n=1 Tax=endosymbiont of Acanthamoeba sp. UWC8 TaxID=86106 RepID=UPI0004D0FE45|nr:MltA domain-containing protein [endosymbiont of Acanthamoeba sp. UWC8]AIF81224.1 membrane-bound lytic murein transglycosylase A [endosymbiont of Acanthamoeba sp. UWC8]
MNPNKIKAPWIMFLLVILGLSSCAPTKTKKQLKEVHFQQAAFSDLKHWEYDCQLDAFKAFQKSCQAIIKRKPNKHISKLTDIGGVVGDWMPVCNEALSSNLKNNLVARLFFEKWFIPYKVFDAKMSDVGKFTGYYEIELNGSRKKTKKFKYPIYATPKDILKLKGKAHFSHSAINKGLLNGKKLEIAYTDNKARLFFMHIQGSGVVKLQEGGELKVGYHNENGHSYKSIGPLFKKHCKDKISSAVDMMVWLHKNPSAGKKIMEENPSYVFFRSVKGDSPIGGQGVPLTSERSIAIDARLYPYGAPVWVETTTPKTTNFPSFDYNRLFIAQDTGGAIKGAIRADIFYGRGKVAEELAGYMNNKGSYYIMFPKNIRIPCVYRAH